MEVTEKVIYAPVPGIGRLKLWVGYCSGVYPLHSASVKLVALKMCKRHGRVDLQKRLISGTFGKENTHLAGHYGVDTRLYLRV
jgi:hypothetical protein